MTTPTREDGAIALPGVHPQMCIRDRQKAALEHAAQIFDELAGVLGLLYNRKKNEVTPEIQELVDRRQAARKAKDFAEAEMCIRDRSRPSPTPWAAGRRP